MSSGERNKESLSEKDSSERRQTVKPRSPWLVAALGATLVAIVQVILLATTGKGPAGRFSHTRLSPGSTAVVIFLLFGFAIFAFIMHVARSSKDE